MKGAQLQSNALAILDHVLEEGLIDARSEFIRGYRETTTAKFCLNYKHNSDWFCPGSMAKVEFPVLCMTAMSLRAGAAEPEVNQTLGHPHPALRVALAQLSIEDGNLDHNMRLAEKAARQAARQEADFLNLPEAADWGWLYQHARRDALPIPGRDYSTNCSTPNRSGVWKLQRNTRHQGKPARLARSHRNRFRRHCVPVAGAASASDFNGIRTSQVHIFAFLSTLTRDSNPLLQPKSFRGRSNSTSKCSLVGATSNSA